VLQMLDLGELPIEKGPLGELRVDLEKVDKESIAFRARVTRTDLDSEKSALLEEVVATEIVSQLDDVFEEAFELALRWTAAENSKND